MRHFFVWSMVSFKWAKTHKTSRRAWGHISFGWSCKRIELSNQSNSRLEIKQQIEWNEGRKIGLDSEKFRWSGIKNGGWEHLKIERTLGIGCKFIELS